MRKLLNPKVAEQGGKCAICNQEFLDYGAVVPDHWHDRSVTLCVMTLADAGIDSQSAKVTRYLTVAAGETVSADIGKAARLFTVMWLLRRTLLAFVVV